MKWNNNQFIEHLRWYRTFYFLFFTFILFVTSLLIYSFGNKIYAGDLLEEAFKPAMTHETIIDIWKTKNAVGNEVLREWVMVDVDLGSGCDVNGNKISLKKIKEQKEAAWYGETEIKFCENILWWTRKEHLIEVGISSEAPLIVRLAKFLLRITMVLAITMVIFNGIMWIIEFAKWAEVKDAKQNIVLIIVGILIALMSLGIINLITSITLSSLWWPISTGWSISTELTNDTTNTTGTSPRLP